jgi:hypothetical protein
VTSGGWQSAAEGGGPLGDGQLDRTGQAGVVERQGIDGHVERSGDLLGTGGEGGHRREIWA